MEPSFTLFEFVLFFIGFLLALFGGIFVSHWFSLALLISTIATVHAILREYG